MQVCASIIVDRTVANLRFDEEFLFFVKLKAHRNLQWNVGATLACGTGACATVVAAVLEGHAERVSNSFKCLYSPFSEGCKNGELQSPVRYCHVFTIHFCILKECTYSYIYVES